MFRLTVTNTGPGPFNGKITVRDDGPAGTKVMAGGAGWTCNAINVGMTQICTTDNAVDLAKNPPSADSVSVDVTVHGSAADAKALGCKLTNKARIDDPLGAPKNIHPADDKDQVTVNLDPKFCDTPMPHTNLKLEKAVDANGCLKGAGVHHCYYNVTVTNTGPDDYNDKIVVEENIPPGMTAVFAGNGWDGCVPAGQDYTCTWNNPPLKMGEKTVLGVQINVPDNMAKEFNCKIKNIAKISYAPGSSNQNTNPNDDEATAIADVPLICDSSVPRSNLRLEKTPARALLGVACKGNPDWCEGFNITVTNTGPNDFAGKVTVTDIAPPGVTIQHIGSAYWTCTGLTCETNNAVKLAKNAPPSDNASFTVIMSGTAAQAKAMNCKLTNTAKISSPLGAPKNFNAADDQDQATADLDPKFCAVPQTNLRLEKTVSEKGCTRGDNFECHYNVKVINAGPGDYNDKIVVNEFIPIGTTVTGDWNCVSGVCTHNPVLLKPGASVVLGVKINVPYGLAKELNCKVTNGAKITYAPGGSTSNTNPNDDTDTATANLPAELCSSESQVEPQCPPGFRWGRDSCDRIGITTLPPVRLCPPGSVGRYPDCHPDDDDDPDCPPGTVGDYPNCRTVDPKCPAGYGRQLSELPEDRRPEVPRRHGRPISELPGQARRFDAGMHGWACPSWKHLRLPRQPGVERRPVRSPQMPGRHARHLPQLHQGGGRSAEV